MTKGDIFTARWSDGPLWKWLHTFYIENDDSLGIYCSFSSYSKKLAKEVLLHAWAYFLTIPQKYTQLSIDQDFFLLKFA